MDYLSASLSTNQVDMNTVGLRVAFDTVNRATGVLVGALDVTTLVGRLTLPAGFFLLLCNLAVGHISGAGAGGLTRRFTLQEDPDGADTEIEGTEVRPYNATAADDAGGSPFIHTIIEVVTPTAFEIQLQTANNVDIRGVVSHLHVAKLG